MKPGFYKVDQRGGSYVVAVIYNPVTGESEERRVRDYEYSDCSRDDDELYYTPIDHNARRLWLRSMGVIQQGDTVEVIRGRKVRVGTVGEVAAVKPVHDRYGRWVADYVYFADGQRTNVTNCRLL